MGAVAGNHDASLAVFDDDKLLNFAKFETKDLDKDIFDKFCRKYGYPEEIVWYEYPFWKSLRQLYAGQGPRFLRNCVHTYLRRTIGYKGKISYVKHHESHAAYAYYTQPDEDCAVVVVDSIGEWETATVWKNFDGIHLEKIHARRYPFSLGFFYSAMTQRVGLQAQRDEGLLYDLAMEGDAKIYYNDVKELLNYNLHRGCNYFLPDANIYDLAASTQLVFEEEINRLVDIAKTDKVAFAGGCAMNKYCKTLGYVPPFCGDAGSSIGAVLAKTRKEIWSQINVNIFTEKK